MARRKRLSPPLGAPAAPTEAPAPGPTARPALGATPTLGAPETKAFGPAAPAPIAQVAGDASRRAALEELSEAVQTARADGRIIERLALEAIDESYLVRDRMAQDADEMEALEASLSARGQQTAIEVTRLEDGRYGLISGWRRLTALRRLHQRSGEDRFATVKALVVTPESAQDAYLAMVEENELRVELSFYERARIVQRALKEGLYPTQRAALQGLFGSTTRARRSKIGSFLPLVEALDEQLKYPTAISERLGLGLAREILRDPGFVPKLRRRLAYRPDRNAGQELAVLTAALEGKADEADEAGGTDHAAPVPADRAAPAQDSAAPHAPAPGPTREHRAQVAPGVTLTWWPEKGRAQLNGPGVDADLLTDLQDWLAARR